MRSGCAMGPQPGDLHLHGLAQLGAEIRLEEGYIHALAPGGLTGAKVVFPKVSVGATEDLLMAACLAKGETEILNAPRQTEVTERGEFPVKMGDALEGLGDDRITVRGRAKRPDAG